MFADRLSFLSAGLIFLFLGVGIPGLAQAAPNSKASAQAIQCLACHAQTDVRMRFKDGSEKSVQLNHDAWSQSAHGKSLACTDCHSGINLQKHPAKKSKQLLNSARDYTVQQSQSCEHCHSVYYTRVLDNIHSKLARTENAKTPICVDCHDAHAPLDSARSSRQAISKNCGDCHPGVYAAYKRSVHGKALQEENNPDVPVCTDCHSTHTITDPRTDLFHTTSYELCAKCHQDEKKMTPYGLTTNVLSTYLEDFHGASNRLYKMSHQNPKQALASCTDCHGIHDIQGRARNNPTHTRAEVRERVIVTCRKCHEGVTPAFADAWLSHYPATLQSAPLVWAVKVIFGVLNPLLITFCLLNVLLNLWRVANRRGRPTYKPF